MSKLEKFKSLAQAALAPAPARSEAIAEPSRDQDAISLHDTERLKSARLIPIERIRPDPHQPRKHFPEKSLEELAASIAAQGVLQPLTVSPDTTGDTFIIVTGERRYRAAQRVGLKSLPCIIVNQITEQQRSIQQLIENLQREDLTPFEEADAFHLLAETFHLKHQQIADSVGKSRSYVTKTLSLAQVPDEVRRLCAHHGIATREQLILIAQQKTESAMLALLNQLAQHGSTVRAARNAARGNRARQRRSRPFVFRYQARGFTVHVRFAKHHASTRDIAHALTTALRSLDQS
ncbi:MAG: ParB/RepB/Spo0J family partition protein [Acidobacteriota bacterium]|nr:ParB/RepB/Spo0J family partition protein [Blastocatellia bacterium]MDW8241251.1 ParB/RepB/Spo0J family partition protein [Acidobacteriota bacterium]